MEFETHQAKQVISGANVKVLVVGAPGFMQQALVRLISQQQEFEVCASVEDLVEAGRWLGYNTAQVVVVDWPASASAGANILQDLITVHPELAWLVVSLYDDCFSVTRAFDLGIRGYITKAMAAETICTAIRAVSMGRLFCSSDIADALPLIGEGQS